MSIEKKFLEDAMNTNKSVGIKKRKIKKTIVVDEKNIYVVDVGEGKGDIDTSVSSAIAKKERKHRKAGRQEIQVYRQKPKITTPKKHIVVKTKFLRGLVPCKKVWQDRNLAVHLRE